MGWWTAEGPDAQSCAQKGSSGRGAPNQRSRGGRWECPGQRVKDGQTPEAQNPQNPVADWTDGQVAVSGRPQARGLQFGRWRR